MIIRVINQLHDDSFPEKIISKGQVATVGHFVDKAPEAQNILLPLDVKVLLWEELHYVLSTLDLLHFVSWKIHYLIG